MTNLDLASSSSNPTQLQITRTNPVNCKDELCHPHRKSKVFVGGDEKKCLDLFSTIDKEHKKAAACKVKGKRELKNLKCSMVM